jgi:hypothetical protein
MPFVSIACRKIGAHFGGGTHADIGDGTTAKYGQASSGG